ncbi:very low-density lipoprotein receptor [Biomphalaria pfeifferi]|uniref:Very low-density lipoprotein receptor n=1 Tax=Biomphalaria pfeifferi TaxID=112525 RepID=A0AAD8AXB3_BIOPF|nr:very low-density lipoprotein receptor [Biomphalaria pfeifferi]
MQMMSFMLYHCMLTLIFAKTTGCNSSEWTCTTGQCIEIGHRCDGTDQCTDTSDEANCSCESSQWTCTIGQCIDIGHRCDGTDQCTDKSDETKCYCDDKPINLLIAIDEGETEDINIIIRDFLKDFLKDVSVNGKNVIVRFLKYKGTTIMAFNRTEVSKVNILKTVDELKWELSPYAEFIDIVSYVNSISSYYFGAYRQRARNILLLITPYLSKYNYLSFTAVTKIIKERGMHIIAVGVELRDNRYLRYVASEPVENNTFSVDASQDLNKIIPSLTSALCEGSYFNEFTDNFTPTLLALTPVIDKTTGSSNLVSTASGSTDYTALIVSLVVITIFFLAIVAYKFKEKFRCFSRNTRISTISMQSKDEDYLDVDHYDYLQHYELKTEDLSKTQDKDTDYHDLLDYDKYDHYNDVHKPETYMGVYFTCDAGNDKELHPEDHYDNLDNKIEMVSEYITPKEIVYNSTAVSDYDKLEQSRGEEHIYGRPRSTGDFTQRPELPAFNKDVQGKPRRITL